VFVLRFLSPSSIWLDDNIYIVVTRKQDVTKGIFINICGENNLRVLCLMLYVVLCYAAAPPFGRPGTPPVRCCNLQCTIQGPLCVNENNGYNGPREKNYRQQAKINTVHAVRHKSDEQRVQIKKKKKKKKKNNLPNLMNDGSKEPQEQDGYSPSPSEKND